MRNRSFILAVAVALTGVAAAPSSEGWTATPGGWVSGDVEYVGSIPEAAGGAVDAVLHEDLLYVTAWHSFSIYDVSDPTSPDQLSVTPLGPSLFNEQPQTNGEILLISRDAGYTPVTDADTPREGAVLEIWDVRDPYAPERLAEYHTRMAGRVLPGVPLQRTERDHLWTCVLDCTYAYSAFGTILDLRDPANPEYVGRWTDVAPPKQGGRMHHIGEVEPGVLMVGSLPMYVLDAREDPTRPQVLASFHPDTTLAGNLVDPIPFHYKNPETLPARSAWPGGLTGRLAVVSMETPLEGQCNPRAGDVHVYRAEGWRGTGEPSFERTDRYVLDTNGTYTDGAPPYNVWGCSAYGLDAHPDFGQAGGLAAVAFFEHGVRILAVDARGAISEHGGFVPIGGVSATPRWLSDDLLYVADIHRGIDILRVG
ncbi:MAG: hypothetical protein KY457_02610 [Actinobacteria bacterium]|nr:hypothetical protein [Actinomycetota bacterium]